MENELAVVLRDISEITPYPGNPRQTAAAVEPVARSIQRFGFRQPIVDDANREEVFYRVELLFSRPALARRFAGELERLERFPRPDPASGGRGMSFLAEGFQAARDFAYDARALDLRVRSILMPLCGN